MFISKSRYSTTFKTIAIVLVCLFCTNSVVLADPDTLAPAVGNPKVYQEMRSMMDDRLAAHQDPIDEFIKQNAIKAKGLSSIPYLEEEFMSCVNACGANNMLTRLKTTLTSAGGKIQVIFVKSEGELPVFYGERAWGHAGTYVTVFALESEKDSKEGRRKIIARLFHEMRARSTRAKDLFDDELKTKNLTTPEEITAFIRSMRESFENDNLQLQQQIEKSSRITSQSLIHEFANLTFAIHPDVMNRDYMMAKKPIKLAGSVTALKVIRDAFRSGQSFILEDYLYAVDAREEFQQMPLQSNGHVMTNDAASRDLQKLVELKIIDTGKTKGTYFVRKINSGVALREEKLLASKRSDGDSLVKSKENRKRHFRGKSFYFFRQGQADGNAALSDVLGNKGANLAEMANMGLPVPPGFTISSKTANGILEAEEYPVDFTNDVRRYVRRIEKQAGYKFGDSTKPLFLSVRGGSRYSMPGFLKTVTNIGFNDETVEGLARLSRNDHFAYTSYIRFILDYAEEVLNIERSTLESVIQSELSKSGVATLDAASVGTLKITAQVLKNRAKELSHKEIPSDPLEQLANSIMAVIASWNAPEARAFRERNSIPHNIGTAVNIQAMVFGNLNEASGTGVVFTRNPLNGEREVFGEVLFNAQGKDIVSGRVTPTSLSELDRRMPEVAKELRGYLETLEKRFKEIQDVEFTIQDGKLFILQTRGNERRVTPLARVRILMDLVQEGAISEEDALKRTDSKSVLWLKKYLEAPTFNPKAQRQILVTGIPASPGIAEGMVCFDRKQAIDLARQGQPVILVLNESFPQDEEAIKAASGTLTKLGGATSHAAIVARGSDAMKPVIVGAGEIQFEKNGFRVGDRIVREGDYMRYCQMLCSGLTVSASL